METTHDFTACIKALTGAFTLSWRALQAELSVSLYVFHLVGGTSLEAKRQLRQVYADAGRPCLNHEDPAYQTVMRRIARSAALFDKLGARRVAKAIRAASGAAALQALTDMLAPLALRTMDDVAAYVAPAPGPAADAAPTREAPEPARRRESDAPDVTHVKTRHIDVAVPPGTPARELVALANKLLALARQLAA